MLLVERSEWLHAARTTNSSPVVIPPSVPRPTWTRGGTPLSGRPGDRIVAALPRPTGNFEAVADLHTLTAWSS